MTHTAKRFVTFLFRVHDRICGGCGHVSAWMMMGLALIISYEVVTRYFFMRPTIWVADFSDYTMLYSTLLASAWLENEAGHVRLTIVTERVSPGKRLVLDVIASLTGAVVCGFIIWSGVVDCWDSITKGIDLVRPLRIPRYLILMVIPFGFFLLLVQFLKNALKSLGILED